jgi:hypothetical protein
MARDQKAALIHLRMSPQLRDALRRAADNAGVSMNSYAVQVLATAAGDPACFRAEVDADHTSPRPKQEWRHQAARHAFMEAMAAEIGWEKAGPLVRKYDAEDPGYFLTWWESRDTDAN